MHFCNGLLHLNMKNLEMKLHANHFCLLLRTAAQYHQQALMDFSCTTATVMVYYYFITVFVHFMPLVLFPNEFEVHPAGIVI